MERRVITVFGGSGFIGRHLVRRFAAEEWIVRVVVRDPERAAFLKMFGDPGRLCRCTAMSPTPHRLPGEFLNRTQ